jgi:23S rRNA pseudouridine1911/1915/1917 synthase
MTGHPLKNGKTIISTQPIFQDTAIVTEGVPALVSAEDEDAALLEHQVRVVGLGDHGGRLDAVLTSLLESFSRSYVQQRIAGGDVQCNQRLVTKTSAKVAAGDVLEIVLRETAQGQAFKPQDIALEVVFEDDYLLVVNKPVGLVVHPAPGNWQSTLMNGLLHRYPLAVQLPRAGIVHRLDKDTSGLMVVAKTRAAMDALVQMIAARDLHREYLALTDRPWSGPLLRQVNSPIGRDPHNRVRMAVVDMGRDPGKQAKTDLLCQDSKPQGALVHCILHTGRTHQIRVHMASVGLPLLGDLLYGGAAKYGLHRQGLHAFRLSFEHPFTHKILAFAMDAPDDFRGAAREMGLRYNLPAPQDGAADNN